MLIVSDVAAWTGHTVAEAVDPAVLDACIAGRAREAGLDSTHPFAFMVEGGLRRVQLHVETVGLAAGSRLLLPRS